MVGRVILEAVTERNYRVYITESFEPGKVDLYCLDCDFDNRGKQFIELPRFYRTVRGAKQGAAYVVMEKLKWTQP